jgi:hypothetical protein
MKRNLAWIMLGIAIGLVLSVAAAYVFGPRGSRTTMNLYTGATWTDHHLLWHTWRSERPAAEHTKWASSHLVTKRTYWPVFVCSEERGWFWGGVHGDGFARDVVREIYNLPVPEERKIELLHEFHENIGNVVVLDSKEPYKRLYEMWDERSKEEP